MPTTTGCTIVPIQPYHDPNEGRVIINENFNCLHNIIDSGLSGISSAATIVLSGTNIGVSGPGGGIPTYTISLDDNIIINSLSSTTISGGTLYSGSTDLYDIFSTTSGGNFLDLSGGTVTGDTIFTQGLSADTITVTTTTVAPLNLPVLATSFTSSKHGDVWISADNVTGQTFFNMVISGVTKSVEIT